MGFVRLSALPDPPDLRSVVFPRLDGGIDLREQEVDLDPDESPEIVNLWWEDGVLQSRPGQVQAAGTISGQDLKGYAATPEAFHDRYFLHISDGIYLMDFDAQFHDGGGRPMPRQLFAGVPLVRGTFFRFGDDLYYKTAGAFLRIAYDGTTDTFTVSDAAAGAYVPTTVLNADPATGGGDLYQPENCLSDKKRVTYNANFNESTRTFAGDGSTRTFSISGQAAIFGVSSVYIDGAAIEPALYVVDTADQEITFWTVPADGAEIVVKLKEGNTTYQLPYRPIDSVDQVIVDGVELTAGTHYTADLTAGTVTFADPPRVTDPPAYNTVEITISTANAAARAQIMGCRYAAVAGTGTQLCIVLGGYDAQPNAVFWSGSTSVGLDPSYWPISQYNLIGDTIDAVTGFGKQYSDLIVFKSRSIGKLDLSVVDLDGRDAISLTYQRVNDRIGCDLPWSIQLIENELTFAWTGGGDLGGVFQVRSSSAAYENNVQRISGKIDGTTERPGLAYDLRVAGASPLVTSHDDGRRYWLSVNGHVWLWDYSISGRDDPSWTCWEGVDPVAFFARDGETYHLDGTGRVTRMARRVFSDYGEGFRKVYQFPVRALGGYDRLKIVETVILSVRADAPSDTAVWYETDYETRLDRVSLTVAGYDRLSERDLSVRDLSVPRHAAAFRRRPMCRHVRHFALRLESSDAGKDLSILSAEILYRHQRRDR